MSIVKVAKFAGVSTSTVSYAINSPDRVRPETVQRVKDAMAALSYSPASTGSRRGPRLGSVRATRVKTSRNLALVAWQLSRAQVSSPIYTDVVHGVESTARSNNCGLLLYLVNEGTDIAEELRHQSIDGIILFGQVSAHSFPKALRNIPTVRVMGTPQPDAWYDHVSFKNAIPGQLAAHYLWDAGHRECAYFGPIAKIGGTEMERMVTFRSEMEALGAHVQVFANEDLVETTGECQIVKRDQMGALLDELLSASIRPTGIFVPADLLTAALYPLAYERGIRPGVDIQIVSCNNEKQLLSNLHPAPAVVDLYAEAIGARAVDQLIWRAANPTAPQTDIYLRPSLIRPT